MIELRDVSARTGTFELTDVSFVVPACSYGVVVGAAGAGKTTLLEIISGVHAPTRGTVLVNSADVTALAPERRAIGLVYQRGALFPHRSVRDNIAWAGGDVRVQQEVAARLSIGNLFNTPVSRLSGGERQLVAIARALVRVRACLDRGESALLLLDEPFSALDPRRRLSTRETVHHYHSAWKLTTLQVTHDGADARRADIAVLMDAGRVVQSGKPAAMLQHPAREDVSLFFDSH